MKHKVAEYAVGLGTGLLFGAGLSLSGMTRPEKVIGFLNIGGAWDASLMLVMAGAVLVHFAAYRWIRGRSAPVYSTQFAVPTRRDIDLKLLLGAALFGAGWGLGGYCPGPSVVSLGARSGDALVFVMAMLLGTLLAAKLELLGSRWVTQDANRSAKAG